MAFQVSPGINISEIDLTTVIPAISTTTAGIVGVFPWGPVGKISQVTSEDVLATKYGKPTDDNYETWFCGASFTSYASSLMVSRAAVTTGYSETASMSLSGNSTIIIADLIDVEEGNGVYGPGIPENTYATGVTANASHTIVTLSADATLGNSTVSNTQSINFFDADYAFNAVANSSVAVNRASYIIRNTDHFEDVSIPAGVEFVAKYPGEYGNSLKISVCDSASQFASVVNPYDIVGYTNNSVIPGGLTGITINVNDNVANVYISNSSTLTFSNTYTAAGVLRSSFSVGDYVEVGNTSTGKQNLKIKSITELANTNPLSPTGTTYFNIVFESTYSRAVSWSANTISRKWEFYNAVDGAPGTSQVVADAGSDVVDQLSVVIVDEKGKFTGNPGTVLEVYQNLSRATDSKASGGITNYYKSVINDTSKYVWAVNDRTEAPSGTGATVGSSSATTPYTKSFVGGRNGITESDGAMQALANAADLFSDAKSIDISLMIAGKAVGLGNGAQYANYLIDNIAETRKDCVVFISPGRAAVVGSNVEGSQVDNIVEFRSSLRSSSYAFIDSGYKYMYDKYNDVYRYVPLNGDIAGLAARTDDTRDPWWSPAGFNRGQIKNIIKLAWNPNQAQRDALYKIDVNPVVSFQGQGTILYGDKTALGRPSAFDRINVRRLFIVLEKTVAIAAQSTLFEFNDEFTRAQFKNLVEPFLRDVQGRRGIYDFKVVCDETNNTPEVIDSNRFVGDIYIKPAKSINFIQLNFVAVRSNVEFNEIVGGF